jgi:hypothetical protein
MGQDGDNDGVFARLFAPGDALGPTAPDAGTPFAESAITQPSEVDPVTDILSAGQSVLAKI